MLIIFPACHDIKPGYTERLLTASRKVTKEWVGQQNTQWAVITITTRALGFGVKLENIFLPDPEVCVVCNLLNTQNKSEIRKCYVRRMENVVRLSALWAQSLRPCQALGKACALRLCPVPRGLASLPQTRALDAANCGAPLGEGIYENFSKILFNFGNPNQIWFYLMRPCHPI